MEGAINHRGIAEARARADAAGLKLITAGMMMGVRYWCALCGKEVVGFNDRRSVNEYKISGACQACQDSLFTE